MTNDTERRATIARLNDHFRRTGDGGTMLLSRGVIALTMWAICDIVQAVRLFDRFTPDNDPHGEHDCAVLDAASRIIWKIDYLPRSGSFVAPLDPADPDAANRVLTIMLAEEY